MTTQDLNTGDLVEFFDKKGLVLGLLIEVKKGRVRALTREGREVSVTPGRVAHSAAAPFWRPDSTRADLMARMADAGRLRKELSEKVSVEELWELLKDEEEGFSPEYLADLVFSGDASPHNTAAVLRALLPDRFHFKYRAGLFYSLRPEQVASLKEQAQRELLRQRALDRACRWLKDAGGEGAGPEDYPEFVEMLKEYCVLGPEYEGRLFVEEALRLAGLPLDPFPVLVGVGVFGEDENLWLKKMGMSEEFAPGAIKEAGALRSAHLAARAPHLEDLTDLDVFTIDGAATRDFDDALHITGGPEGFEVGIHLADVAALIRPQSELDGAAFARGASIYLPDGLIPMLPRDLSEDLFSLKEGELKGALSIIVDLSPEGEVRGFDVKRSQIRVKRRLTYWQADELLAAGDGEMTAALRLARLLKEQRTAAGARLLPLPDIAVVIMDDGEIQVRKYEDETPSQELVSEMMILANRLGALYLKEEGVPALFRSQEPMPEPDDAQADPHSLFSRLMMLRKMPRAEIGTVPKRHHGLGLDPYTGITSPIRKYFDLVVQRQISAHLAGEALPHSAEELEQMAIRIDLATRTGNFIKRRWTRYWILKYLAGKKGEVFEALVTDKGRKTARLVLVDFMLDLSVAPEISLAPGDSVRLRITRVEPRDDIIKAELA